MGNSIQVLRKQPSESRIYEFEFAANMTTGESLSGVTSLVTTGSGLTVGSPAYSGTKVTVRLSAGTTGSRYKLTCVVTTSLGNTLELDGYLDVYAK